MACNVQPAKTTLLLAHPNIFATTTCDVIVGQALVFGQTGFLAWVESLVLACAPGWLQRLAAALLQEKGVAQFYNNNNNKFTKR
jgi:pheromone shutdown protein TraB